MLPSCSMSDIGMVAAAAVRAASSSIHQRGTEGISVRDTGPGLTSEQRARLFQAFDRLGAEHAAVAGHGLGLLLCRELLLAMDGVIEVDSVEGAGCTFTVTLPGRSA